MTRNSLIAGLGLAVVSAALIALATGLGPFLGAAVALFAPMPIAFAGLGWGWMTGAFTAAVASLLVLSFAGPANALAFGVTLMAPMVALTYLAQLCRYKAKPTPMAPDELEWYPAGSLVFWAAIAAGITPMAVLLLLHLDLETLRAAFAKFIEQSAKAMEAGGPNAGGPARPLTPEEIKTFTDVAISAFPAALAISNFLTVIMSLWLAGRVALSSGALNRPWPDVAFFEMPRVAPLALAAALFATLANNDYVVLFGTALGGSFFVAYLLLGLAVAHAVTRGQSWRPFALVILYAVLLIPNITPWPGFLVVLLGLMEPVFHLRARLLGSTSQT